MPRTRGLSHLRAGVTSLDYFLAWPAEPVCYAAAPSGGVRTSRVPTCMGSLRTLDSLASHELESRRVFVRADLNVPRAGERILDDTRLRATVPTLQELSGRGARVLVFSHYGRPQGERVEALSLEPVGPHLSRLLGSEVAFADDCVGETARDAARATPAGGFRLFENLRFHPGEEANDEDFAARLAELAEVYVDDAFGVAHRAHASVVGVPARLSERAAGRLLEREVAALSQLLEDPEAPFVVILGGAKIRGKMETLENLLDRVDSLLLGGAMANTFLRAQGQDLGSSLVAEDEIELARRLLDAAEERQLQVVLPRDLVVTDRIPGPEDEAEDVRWEVCAVSAVSDGLKAVDVGPATLEAFDEVLAEARTVFWNGPVGLFEVDAFAGGSLHVARALGACAAYSVVGGGETVAVLNQAGVSSDIDHVSTGGGASLEFLAGKDLPGVAALREAGA